LSPRLSALRREVESGNGVALDAFWREIAVHGAPVIEPVPDNPDDALVTFLWRATGQVANVVVIGGLAARNDYSGNRMTPLPGTDLWFKTYRARKDLRTTYQLSPNDPLTPAPEVIDWEARATTWQPDPLNPKRFTFPSDPDQAGSTERSVSLLELPDAPPQPWIVPCPDLPTGHVAQHRFQSGILDNERRLWVYTPPDYAVPGLVYDLLILFDGSDYAGRLIPTPTILDNLLGQRRIRPVVALMIDNGDLVRRHHELACDPHFLACLAEEIVPWARQRYHVTTDPARTVVGGLSLGAVMASYAGVQRPDLFGNVLSQSGAYWWGPQWTMTWSPETGPDVEWEWLARKIVTTPSRPVRFYLEVGRLEIALIWSDFPGQLAPNRHLRDVLEAKGYAVTYSEFNGGHDHVCWRGSLADGLHVLLSPDAAPDLGTGL
jgi:enterochelin esterase family protein